MRARTPAIEGRQSDSPAHFSLAWTGVVAFVLLITRNSPDPALFLPVAFAALPFTAAPRHRVAFRLLAAALLIVFVAMRGPEPADLAFTPAIAGILLSAYNLAIRDGSPARGGGRRRRRRSRRS